MLLDPSTADRRFIERVRSAPFIFTGRVLKARPTLSQLASVEGLVVVQVQTVFRAPPVFRTLAGARVTVRLATSKRVRTGDRLLFYATSWLYGDSVAVAEIAREPAPRDPEGLLARVARAELRIADELLTARLRAAVLVLTGMVESIGPSERVASGAPHSEHDPLWWRADIELDRIEKGALREARARAFFASSLDGYWLELPKLQPGQRGVFLLHRATTRKETQFAAPGPALVDPLDFQPITHIERVRALLKLSRG